MANTRITTAMSAWQSSGVVFQDYTGGSFILDPGAYLVTAGATAVELGGNFTATINGSLAGNGASGNGLAFFAVAPGNVSTLNSNAGSSIYGGSVGVLATELLNVNNAGVLSGNIGLLEMGSGTYAINNSGRISGSTSAIDFAGTGSHTLNNSGVVDGASYAMRAGVGVQAGREVVNNSGQIYGEVFLGDGSDVFTNYRGTVQGTVTGTIDLGNGTDRFNGGSNAERVIDGGGSDTVNFGEGNDIYFAVKGASAAADGIDSIDGGLGIDLYDARAAATGVFLNFDTVAHTDVYYGATVQAGNVNGLTTGTDVLLGFERAMGGSASDVLMGNGEINVFWGNGFGDDLFGFGGNDVLYGGAGGDYLIGGLGADRLSGGVEGDRFVFGALADSTVASSGRDTLTDFSVAEGDRIDLSEIDGNSLAGGNNAFALTAAGGYGAFTHAAGQLRFEISGGNTIVSGDVNGDGAADFAITVTGTQTLHAAEFIL